MIQEGFRRLGIVFGVVLAVVWLIGSSWMVWETSSRDYRKEKIAKRVDEMTEKELDGIIAQGISSPKEPTPNEVTWEDIQKAKEMRRRLATSRNPTEELTPSMLIVIGHYKWRFLSIPVGAIVLFWIPSGLLWVVGWVFAGFKS
jgi:hypothetical protein